MSFDDSLIDRIRNSADIFDLASGHVQLKKAGQNYRGLCPFHSEKTPSFNVNPSKQIFKCFGCGIGGDVFRFVMEIEGLNFPEAVRLLAERNAIPLPASGAREPQGAEDRKRLYALMTEAASFFRRNLKPNSPPHRYLTLRKIEPPVQAGFGLGYAPGNLTLLKHLKGLGYSDAELETCGLVKKSEAGEISDKFWRRVVFPIRSLSGQTIAFGGRVLDDGFPKYLNSPETPLYHKGDHLYGLDAAREEIRKRDVALLVEGYFDCIVPHQFGFCNTVASLGTSLTDAQVRLLGRFTRKIVISFDSDAAGLSAALRSIDLFLQQGFHVNVLQLPEGSDPDSFLRTQGAEAFRELVQSSAPCMEFVLAHSMNRQRDPHSPAGKQQVVNEIIPYLLKMPNRIERAEYVSRVASRLRIHESLILLEMRKRARPGRQQLQLNSKPAEQSPTQAETYLLHAVFQDRTQESLLSSLEAELFDGLPCNEIFGKVFELRKRCKEISVFSLREQLSGESLELFDRLTLRALDKPVSKELIIHSIRALKDLQLERLSRQIQEEIVREEKNDSDTPRLLELLRRKERLRREKLLGAVEHAAGESEFYV